MSARPASVGKPDLLNALARHPSVVALAHALVEGRRVVATGVTGSGACLTAAALLTALNRPIVLVVAHLDDADEALDELTSLGLPALRLPALEAIPGESSVALDQLAERLSVIRTAAADASPRIVVCPIQALMQPVPTPARIEGLSRTLRKGQSIRLTELVNWLATAGYNRVESVEEPGEFAVRGGILDVYAPGTASAGGVAAPASVVSGVPVRLDFFGDDIDRITEIDLETMGSDRAVEGVELVAADLKAVEGGATINFLEILPREAVALLHETMEVVEQGRGYFERVSDGRSIHGPPAVLKILEARFHALAELNQFSAGASAADVRISLPFAQLPAFAKDAAEAVKELGSLAAETPHSRAIVPCQNEGELQRFGELVTQFAPEHQARITGTVGYLHRGLVILPDSSGNTALESTEGLPLLLVPYHELLGRFTLRRRSGRLRSGRAMDTFLDFQPGDYVVHQDHGIARFIGLTLLAPRALPGTSKPLAKKSVQEQEEYLTLEFASKSKLHVPAMQIDLVQKYVGGFAGKPPLSTMGGQKWKNQKEKVSDSVRDLAAELLRVRAAREHMPGIQYPGDTKWQTEFEAEFPYTETEDQLAAMSEIKKDMTSSRPMDRLICGDVGFGKTELAIRAAFKAVEFGRQVAVLVPTTVLAEQHERTFRSRFAGYPFRIESLSRFKSTKEVSDTLAAARKGQVDILIGTHRILSQDVRFADLGLVVIDEEQRFGVEHKESLLRLRLTVDVLTLSATPIPRTLHMAMLGIRDISSLTTAPVDRRAIVTEVIPFNAIRLKQAIDRELAREGQVFFVHNRVHDILSVADDVRRLAPTARIVIGHGQMDPQELEEVILKFVRHEADILVSTTIIESGIDIASANTMIVKDADRFGLAELHQLRGRVGRSKHRAYCYLLIPDDRTVNEVAQKRLKAIEQYSMLGAGFKIAMRDLEIRGAGNILGSEQSGHIAAVGYEMYCRLLEDAVHDLKNDPRPPPVSSTSIEIGVAGSIPRAYIPSELRRLEAYRRLATAGTVAALTQVRADLAAAYGEPPRASFRLFDLAELRVLASALRVRTITIRDKDVVFLLEDPAALVAQLSKVPKGSQIAKEASVRALPPKEPGHPSEVYFRPPENYMDPDTLLRILRKRLSPA